MVNFFDQQEAARKRTALCVLLYAVAVAGVTVCTLPVVVVLVFIVGHVADSKSERSRAVTQFVDQAFQHPLHTLFTGSNLPIVVVAAICTLGLIFGASIIRYLSLRRGGSAVALGLGARRIYPSTGDLDERRLVNVVEEMALASGVPVPEVFVMEGEDGVNAFAAGHTPSDAAVTVTRGALRRLNREQLQGVVAHEFSHILNGDMRLNMRLIGLLYGIVCVGLLGRILAQARGDRKGNGIAFLGLLLIVIGAVGTLCAKLIQAMISRQREYLADASAVQFTRNPDGIAGALKVIGGTLGQGRLNAARAGECDHMMIAACTGSHLGGPMATHPPLEDRIRRLDPHWDGRFLHVDERVDESAAPPATATRRGADFVPGVTAALAAAAMAQKGGGPGGRAPVLQPIVSNTGLALSAGEVMGQVGRARATLASIPPRLVEAAREPFSARALLLAMLLDADEDVRQQQLKAINTALDGVTAHNTLLLMREMKNADRSHRLALVDLSVASLAALSREQYTAFRAAVKAVIAADGKVDLFELCVERLLVMHLDRRHVDARPTPVQYYNLARLGNEVGTLLWATAYAGGPERAGAYVDAGITGLSLPPGRALPRSEVTAERIGTSLMTLQTVTPKLRLKIVAACATIVGADGRVDPPEAELLRAIADSLEVPLMAASGGARA